MFGLLGGLLGGALRGGMAARGGIGGAVLGGLMSRRANAAGSSNPVSGSAPVQTESPMKQEAAEAPVEQPKAETPPPEAQASQAQPMVTTAAREMGKPAALQGLLEEAPPVAPPPPPQDDKPLAAQSIVNVTDSPTPAARPITEKFGAVPGPQGSDMIDRITGLPPRRRASFPDMNPSKSPDLEQENVPDQGYRYPAPGNPASQSAGFRYMRV